MLTIEVNGEWNIKSTLCLVQKLTWNIFIFKVEVNKKN